MSKKHEIEFKRTRHKTWLMFIDGIKQEQEVYKVQEYYMEIPMYVVHLKWMSDRFTSLQEDSLDKLKDSIIKHICNQ